MYALVYHGRLHSGLSRRDRRAVPADSQAHGPGQHRIEYGLVSSDFGVRSTIHMNRSNLIK